MTQTLHAHGSKFVFGWGYAFYSGIQASSYDDTLILYWISRDKGIVLFGMGCLSVSYEGDGIVTPGSSLDLEK